VRKGACPFRRIASLSDDEAGGSGYLLPPSSSSWARAVRANIHKYSESPDLSKQEKLECWRGLCLHHPSGIFGLAKDLTATRQLELPDAQHL
jgi:hypothetical protein